MKRQLVIGYGNPLRQDDGIGWRAAEIVAAQLPPDTADVIQCHQLAPELSASIETASAVFFLDAGIDQTPGTVTWHPLIPAEPGASAHALSAPQLLGLTQQLSGNAPPAWLISGGPFQMGFGDHLTPCGEACAQAIADAVIARLTSP